MEVQEASELCIVEKALTLAWTAFSGLEATSQVQIIQKEVCMNKINWQDMLFLAQRMTNRVGEMIINVIALLVNDQRYAAVPVIHHEAAQRVGLKSRRY